MGRVGVKSRARSHVGHRMDVLAASGMKTHVGIARTCTDNGINILQGSKSHTHTHTVGPRMAGAAKSTQSRRKK